MSPYITVPLTPGTHAARRRPGVGLGSGLTCHRPGVDTHCPGLTLAAMVRFLGSFSLETPTSPRSPDFMTLPGVCVPRFGTCCSPSRICPDKPQNWGGGGDKAPTCPLPRADGDVPGVDAPGSGLTRPLAGPARGRESFGLPVDTTFTMMSPRGFPTPPHQGFTVMLTSARDRRASSTAKRTPKWKFKDGSDLGAAVRKVAPDHFRRRLRSCATPLATGDWRQLFTTASRMSF